MDNLQCEICTELYDNADRRPKNLPCGHTFCKECMAKEISKGKTTCPSCRAPHNATSIKDLPMNVVLDRIIRDITKTLSLSANASKSDDEEEEDYSGGPCSTHKKSVVYFFCQTHSVNACRECTVIEHPTTNCKVVPFKDELERRKQVKISEAITHVTGINKTLAALDQFVEEKSTFISNKELKIQQWEKDIEDARKEIAAKKNNSKEAKDEISQGNMKRKDMEDAMENLRNAKTKKVIEERSNNLGVVSTKASKWTQEMNKEFKLLPKITDVSSMSPTMVYCPQEDIHSSLLNNLIPSDTKDINYSSKSHSKLEYKTKESSKNRNSLSTNNDPWAMVSTHNMGNNQPTNTFQSECGNTAIPEICYYSVIGKCKFAAFGCQRLHSKYHYHWQVQIGSGTWLNLQIHQVECLEKNYCNPAFDTTVLPVMKQNCTGEPANQLLALLGYRSWNVDFQRLQISNMFINKHKLRRLTSQNVASDPVSSNTYIWYFEDEMRRWIEYGRANSLGKQQYKSMICSKDIEREYITYQSNRNKNIMMFNNEMHNYIIDFDIMDQTNTRSNVKRVIKRRPEFRHK